jgi:hypothetical protein
MKFLDKLLDKIADKAADKVLASQKTERTGAIGFHTVTPENLYEAQAHRLPKEHDDSHS